MRSVLPAGESGPTSACTSLKATPVPQSIPRPTRVRGTLGIDDHVGGGELGAGQVVIGDDDANPAALARATASTAVMPQSQVTIRPAPSSRRLGQAGRPEVVAVSHPMGDERVHHCPAEAERSGQHGGRALAVDIVVAMHQDRRAGGHRVDDDCDRFGHSGERQGIGERVERWPEEVAGGSGGGDVALQQQRAKGTGTESVAASALATAGSGAGIRRQRGALGIRPPPRGGR